MSKELDPVVAEALLTSLPHINIAELLKILNSKLRFNATLEGVPLQIDIHLKSNEILARIKVVENGD